MASVPTISLNNGKTIPQFGFGVFQIKPADTVSAVRSALDAGYRHIDTAQMYGNEREVGQAIRDSGIARDELFVTTKLNNDSHEPERARAAVAGSLTALGMDYVDLFLIHWPLPTRYGGDFISTWNVLEEAYADGRSRSIGVSNFQPAHLEKLLANTTVVPAVNQIEVSPYLTNEVARAACIKHGIAIEAWSPIARGKDLLEDPIVTEIAGRVGKTPAQVVLRWHIERGDIVFPKSVRPERMAENIDIFDFSLEGDDVAAITSLNRDQRTGPDPDTFDWIPD